jgi:hypothetical protein
MLLSLCCASRFFVYAILLFLIPANEGILCAEKEGFRGRSSNI